MEDILLKGLINLFTGQSENQDPYQQDNKWVNSIIQPYTEKNFIQRLLNPKKYPQIKNKDDSYSTHKMSYATTDNGAIVYPNIIYDENKNKLKELSPEEAMQYALKTGEYIPFKNEQEADKFSSYAYKSILGKKFYNQALSEYKRRRRK